MALHGGNHRLWKIRDLLNNLGVEMRFGVCLHMIEDLAHVIAGREIEARAAEDHETYFFGLARNCVDVLAQRLEHTLGERV